MAVRKLGAGPVGLDKNSVRYLLAASLQQCKDNTETVTEDFITEHCCLCGQCILEQTGGLCPLALCAKGLLNGPCGGAQEGKCEVDRERDCGWHLIYERLRALGRMELMHQYVPPKDHLRRSSPRSLSLEGRRADFRFSGKTVSAWSGED